MYGILRAALRPKGRRNAKCLKQLALRARKWSRVFSWSLHLDAVRVMLIIFVATAAGCGGGVGEQVGLADRDGASLDAASGINDDPAAEVGGEVAWPAEDFRTAPADLRATRERALAATVDGVTEGFVPGCNRATSDDFIDGGTWNNRRLLPRQCEILKYNPPSFSWRVPTDHDPATGWSFVLKTTGGATVVSTKVTQPSYRLGSALPAGDYEWQVSYPSKLVKIGTVTSDVRLFRVPAGAEIFLAPDGQMAAKAAAAKPRPRVLPAGSSFSDVRDLVSTGEYADAYRSLLYRAELVMSSPLPKEPSAPPTTGTNSWKKWRQATAVTSSDEQKAIEALGFAWRLSGDVRFRDWGLARLLSIASWNPSGSTSFANHDEANAILALALARGFDLFSSELTSARRDLLIASVRIRLGQILPEFALLDRSPYNSHGIQNLRLVTDALLWLAGEDDFPEALGWLVTAWDTLIRVMDTWGDTDGGYGNGVAYAWFEQDDLADVLVNIKVVTGFDMTRHPWVKNFPDYLMTQTAAGSAHFLSAGDNVEVQDLYGTYAHKSIRLYALMTRNPQLGWYWRQGAGASNPNVYISPYHFIAFAVWGGSAAPKAPVQHSWLFRDAGMVAIHDDPAATADRSTVHFRSSRFGSFNHSFADQNAFALISKGKSLLISGGYYPWYLSNHHAMVGRATRYKNALTFDGGIGQAEPVPSPTAPGKPMQSMDARGEIVAYDSKGAWSTATGDATLAYRGWNKTTRAWTPLLTEALRTIAYNRSERVVIIYDYASSATARQFELNFNALAPFTAADKAARVDYDGAAACIRVYGAKGGFAAASGFAVAPEFARPQQYQARFSAPSATTFAAVTVIREDCRNVPVSVQKSGTTFSVSIAGAAPITLGRSATYLP